MQKKALKAWSKAGLTALLVAGVIAAPAFAGTGGTEFTQVYDLLSGWAKGTLGKIISLAIFIVGIAAGIVQQSVMAAVAGVGGALVMFYGPDVIENIVSALI